MNAQPTVEVCLSPQLLHLYPLQNRVVVIVDVLRATSTIITALAHEVAGIIPVAKLEQCEAYKRLGFITAAERDGKKAEGFDLGNSPFSYMAEELKGKTIVFTTTNGTEAISKSSSASLILIGGFLNITALSKFLIEKNQDTLLLCAAWKGKPNIEDTLFTGALLHKLLPHFSSSTDDNLLALSLYQQAMLNKWELIQKSSHVKRLQGLGIERDIEFCLTEDLYPVVPYFNGEALVI
jgi:2-phosphosulfolactate phosphatase